MTTPPEPSAYGWLEDPAHDAGSGMREASCFTFVHGLSLDEVIDLGRVRRGGLRTGADWDLEGDGLVEDGSVALFEAEDGWVVAYQDNGFPEQFATYVGESMDAERVVVVFWNVNAAMEFSLWESGQRIVTFTESPWERWGTEPGRLAAEVDTVFGERQEESWGLAVRLWARMLTLADLVTGCHLDVDFLESHHLVWGVVEELADELPGDTAQDLYETWTKRDRRKVSARIARLACEAAGISDVEPAKSALVAIEKRQPQPTAMADPAELRKLFTHAVPDGEDPWALDGEALDEGTPKSRVKAAILILNQINDPINGRHRPDADLDFMDFHILLDTAEATVEPSTPSVLNRLWGLQPEN